MAVKFALSIYQQAPTVTTMPIRPFLSSGDLAGLCSPQLSLMHEMAEALGNAIDAKDTHTRHHSEEVAEVGKLLAVEMGLPPHKAELVHIAAHLHDLGKIGVPEQVLFKPGPLTADEWALVRQHPVIGAEIVRPIKAFNGQGGIADMILHHHERHDGRGYPHGLAGEAVPLGARIIAVADSLSAMLQHRPYRQGLSFEAASLEILAGSGSRYDPDVVRAFASCRDGIKALVGTGSRQAFTG